MSRSKATKRRKAWVNLYPDGRHTLYRTRKEALKIRGLNSEGTVPMVEHLPGDVVLSREDAERVAKALLGAASHVPPALDAFRLAHEAITLLRGRR